MLVDIGAEVAAKIRSQALLIIQMSSTLRKSQCCRPRVALSVALHHR